MTNLIVTEIDEFFAIVKERGEVSIEEACDLMETEVGLIERWAKALNDVGMVSLHYPMVHTRNGKVKVRFRQEHLGSRTSAYPTQSFLLPSQ